MESKNWRTLSKGREPGNPKGKYAAVYKVEILTDLAKKMSISGDLDTGTLLAGKVSDQFGTVESSRELDDQAFVKGRSGVTRTQSEGDLNLNDKMDRPMREEIGKRKKKHTAHWLEYQSS